MQKLDYRYVWLTHAVEAYSRTNYLLLTLTTVAGVKPGFHYPSWRPEWPVSITRQHGPLTRAVNSGSGNRA